MNVLMPCAGLNSRFPAGPPKYLRTMNDMRPMFSWALDSMRTFPDGIAPFFAIRKEHDEQWDAAAVIRQFEPTAQVLVLDRDTRGPACTVEAMLRHFGVHGGFVVKDCDCAFRLPQGATWPTDSAVYVAWRETATGDRGSKSWIEERNGEVRSIVEKQRPRDWYCHGGYQFGDVADYLHTFQRIEQEGEIFVSHVISKMLDAGFRFMAKMVCEAHDWGIWDNYVSFRQKRKAYFIDLDGCVTTCGTPYGPGGWATTTVLPGVAEKIAKLRKAGSSIYFLTGRLASEAEHTEATLSRAGVRWDRIIYGIQGGTRVLVNDYADSNPYPACEAINTFRDSADWLSKVQ